MQKQRDLASGVQGLHSCAMSSAAVLLTTAKEVAGSGPWPMAGCPNPASQVPIRGATILIWDGHSRPAEVGHFFFLSNCIKNTKYDLQPDCR